MTYSYDPRKRGDFRLLSIDSTSTKDSLPKLELFYLTDSQSLKAFFNKN